MDIPEKYVDLHMHSTASDGSALPCELVALAKEKGLAGIALTDHDTISGLNEFLSAAREQAVEAVPGVEISTRLYSKELHIVGLFIDPGSPELLAMLEKMREGREIRNRATLEKLSIIGYPVTYEELLEIAGGESIGRPHIAQLLVKKGFFPGIREAFEHCLKRGCRSYVPRELPDPAKAIEAIHQAHGLAVWAHPVSGQSGERAFARKMLRLLIPAGLDGVEVRYSMFSPSQTEMMEGLAGEFGLLSSGGSDYHGKNQPGIELGTGRGELKVPADFLEKMKQHLETALDHTGSVPQN